MGEPSLHRTIAHLASAVNQLSSQAQSQRSFPAPYHDHNGWSDDQYGAGGDGIRADDSVSQVQSTQHPELFDPNHHGAGMDEEFGEVEFADMTYEGLASRTQNTQVEDGVEMGEERVR